jgi:hypothetical protein
MLEHVGEGLGRVWRELGGIGKAICKHLNFRRLKINFKRNKKKFKKNLVMSKQTFIFVA